MSLNSAIQILNTNKSLFYQYTQQFNKKYGFFNDSSYINYINFTNENIIITFPQDIDIISNIEVDFASYRILADDTYEFPDIIQTKKYKNLKLVIYDIIDNNHLSVQYDVYILKNKLKALL